MKQRNKRKTTAKTKKSQQRNGRLKNKTEILEINKIKILIGRFCSTEEVSKGSVNLKIKQQKLANLNNREKKNENKNEQNLWELWDD